MQHIWSFFPSKYYLYIWFIIHVEMLVYQSVAGSLSKLLLTWNISEQNANLSVVQNNIKVHFTIHPPEHKPGTLKTIPLKKRNIYSSTISWVPGLLFSGASYHSFRKNPTVETPKKKQPLKRWLQESVPQDALATVIGACLNQDGRTGWLGKKKIYGGFRKWWCPQMIHFNKVFHYRPSILGYPYFWKHPDVYFQVVISNMKKR